MASCEPEKEEKEEKAGEESCDETVLTGAVCDERAKKFAELSGTDEACAHFFLQDCNWDLDTALNRFLDQSRAGNEESESSGDEESSSGQELRFLTWNVDGLDQNNLTTRTKAVCTIILTEKPDVVFLQEVIEDSWAIIAGYLQDKYEIFSGKDESSPIPYFTLTIIAKTKIKCLSHSLIPFESSVMGRTLLIVRAKLSGIKLVLINSHMESMAPHSNERKRQLQKAFELMRAESDKATVIVAGDLNARDKEVAAVGGLPSNVSDAWIETGRRKFTEYTWDMFKNDNHESGEQFKARCRFDRVFYTNDGTLRVKDFKLVGMQRIKNLHCFPSDHWGVLTEFSTD